MKNYKKILFFAGILLILIYFYIRFILKREDKSLFYLYISDNTIYYNIFLMLFTLILFFISILNMIFVWKLYKKLPIKLPQNFVTTKILSLLAMIKESLLAVNDFIAEHVPNSYEILKSIIVKFHNYFGKHAYGLILVFYIIPYLLTGFSLVIDTFIFFKLHYFYKILPVIILPLLFNIFLFLINELLKNIHFIEESIIITHEFLPNGKDHFSFKPKVKIKDEQQLQLFQENINEFLCLYRIKSFLDYYYTIEHSLKLLSLFAMYCCFLISCIYIHFFNLYNLIYYLFL